MASEFVTAPEASHHHLAHLWPHLSGVPLSRPTALRRWRAAIAWTVAVQASAVLVDVASGSLAGLGSALSGLLSVAEAGLIALVLVAMTRHAEERLLCRPPKALLGWQLGAFVTTAVVQTALLFVHPDGDWFFEPAFVAIHVLAGLGFLLVAGWLLGTKVILAGIEEDRAG
jgi:hypothetical protein